MISRSQLVLETPPERPLTEIPGDTPVEIPAEHPAEMPQEHPGENTPTPPPEIPTDNHSDEGQLGPFSTRG